MYRKVETCERGTAIEDMTTYAYTTFRVERYGMKIGTTVECIAIQNKILAGRKCHRAQRRMIVKWAGVSVTVYTI